MNKKYLISETTKEERKKIVENAIGITLLGTEMPSKETLNLAKEYINGNIEISDIQNKVLKKYTKEENKQ